MPNGCTAPAAPRITDGQTHMFGYKQTVDNDCLPVIGSWEVET